MNENVLAKLKVLAESAKYDVSCSSSGTVRRNQSGTLGNTVGGWGICHSFAEDGRCHTIIKEFPFSTYLKRAAHLRLQGTERSRIIRLGNPARCDMAYRIANE